MGYFFAETTPTTPSRVTFNGRHKGKGTLLFVAGNVQQLTWSDLGTPDSGGFYTTGFGSHMLNYPFGS